MGNSQTLARRCSCGHVGKGKLCPACPQGEGGPQCGQTCGPGGPSTVPNGTVGGQVVHTGERPALAPEPVARPSGPRKSRLVPLFGFPANPEHLKARLSDARPRAAKRSSARTLHQGDLFSELL